MQIAQFVADACCCGLITRSQHLFYVTIGCENKNDLKENLWSRIPGALVHNIA
jgi:hypothetical protein